MRQYLKLAICFTVLMMSGCINLDEVNKHETGLVRDSESVTFQVTRCFGNCPVYEVTIQKNGQLVFNGQAHTKVIGASMRTISSAKANQVLRILNRYKPNVIGKKKSVSNCKRRVSDLPSFIITWRGKNFRQFSHNTGCRDASAKRISSELKSIPSKLGIQDLIR